MEIGNRPLFSTEKEEIMEIYKKIKTYFPNVKIKEKTDYLGIGMDGYHLICYFTVRENSIFVKFKNLRQISIFDYVSVKEDMEKAIHLFKTQDLRLKKRISQDRSANAPLPSSPQQSEAPLISLPLSPRWERIYVTYESIKASFPEENLLLSFDGCSRRLKNALYRSHILTVKDLFALSAPEVASIHYLGVNCFDELCNYLSFLSVNGMAAQIPTAISEDAQERGRKIQFILEVRANFLSPPDPLLKKNEKTLDEYRDIYKRILQQISNAIKLKLHPREASILISRFGIGETAKTLEEIGLMHSLTRERVRQLIVKSIRKLKYVRTSSQEFLETEYEKACLISEVESISLNKFVAYMHLEAASSSLIQFISEAYFKKELPTSSSKSLC